MQKRKLTKRQRKCLRTESQAVKFSMKNGQEIEFSDRTYVGAPAIYSGGRKLKHGVPYVRTS